MFDNEKVVFYFLFLLTKNKVFIREYCLVVFNYFLRVVYKNNYTNM